MKLHEMNPIIAKVEFVKAHGKFCCCLTISFTNPFRGGPDTRCVFASSRKKISAFLSAKSKANAYLEAFIYQRENAAVKQI